MDQSDDFLIISSVAYILSILDLLPFPGCAKVYFHSGGGFDLLHPSDRFRFDLRFWRAVVACWGLG